MKKLRSLLLALILIPVLVLFTACGADGDAGAKGDTGAAGEQGIQGETGEQGEPGATGDTVLVVGGKVFVIAADGTITTLEGTEVGSLTLYDVKGVAIVMDGTDAYVTKLVTEGDIQFFAYDDNAYIFEKEEGEFVYDGEMEAIAESTFLFNDAIYVIAEDEISLVTSIDVTKCDCTGTTGCEVTGHTGASHTCDHDDCARTKALTVSTDVGTGNATNLAIEYVIVEGFVVVVDVDTQTITNTYEITMVDTLQTIRVAGEVYVKSGNNFVLATAEIQLLAGNTAVAAIPAVPCTHTGTVGVTKHADCTFEAAVPCTHTGTVGETKASDCTFATEVPCTNEAGEACAEGALCGEDDCDFAPAVDCTKNAIAEVACTKNAVEAVPAVAAKDKVTVIEYNGVAYFITGPVDGDQVYTSKTTMTASGADAAAKVTFTYGGKTYERLLSASAYTDVTPAPAG